MFWLTNVVLGPVEVDGMAAELSGIPRMVLRPGMHLDPSLVPCPQVLLIADAGWSPTLTGRRGGLIRHTVTLATITTKVRIIHSLGLGQILIITDIMIWFLVALVLWFLSTGSSSRGTVKRPHSYSPKFSSDTSRHSSKAGYGSKQGPPQSLTKATKSGVKPGTKMAKTGNTKAMDTVGVFLKDVFTMKMPAIKVCSVDLITIVNLPKTAANVCHFFSTDTIQQMFWVIMQFIHIKLNLSLNQTTECLFSVCQAPTSEEKEESCGSYVAGHVIRRSPGLSDRDSYGCNGAGSHRSGRVLWQNQQCDPHALL